jgi:hypothetical protein
VRVSALNPSDLSVEVIVLSDMTTTGSSIHVTDADIERFWRKALPGAALVLFTDHLDICADCRRRLSRQRDLEAALASIERGLDREGQHVSESDVHAFVDGQLDPPRRHEISAHLVLCASCAAEVRDLQGWAAEEGLQASAAAPAATRIRPAWWYGGLAAAALLALAVIVPGLFRTGNTQTGDALRDADSAVSVNTDRALAATHGLSPDDVERVRRILSTGQLSFPSYMPDLVGRRGVLLGDAAAVGFDVLAPVGTAVMDDRPSLRWTSAAASATYVVTVQDQTTGATISSPPLSGLEWRPESPLVRGRLYLWQVAASVDGHEVVAPKPPDPPAKTFVLSAADAATVAQAPPSPLVRGILFAQFGLLDEAERAFTALPAQSPGADIAQRFLRQVRELRIGRPQSSRP